MDKLESQHLSRSEDGQLGAIDSVPAAGHLASPNEGANEGVYRFVAYSSGYLFWLTVIGLSAGIVLL